MYDSLKSFYFFPPSNLNLDLNQFRFSLKSHLISFFFHVINAYVLECFSNCSVLKIHSKQPAEGCDRSNAHSQL